LAGRVKVRLIGALATLPRLATRTSTWLMAVAVNAGTGCLTDTDKSGRGVMLVVTVFDVNVPTAPPPVTLALVTLAPAVVGLTLMVTVSGVFDKMGVALLQVTICNAAVHVNPPVDPEPVGTKVSPAGNVLLNVVAPVVAVADVLMIVAV
jgi:hypothetical protein